MYIWYIYTYSMYLSLLIFFPSFLAILSGGDLLERPRVCHGRHGVDLTVPDLDLYTHLRAGLSGAYHRKTIGKP